MSAQIQSTNQSHYRYDARVGTAMTKVPRGKARTNMQRIATVQKNAMTTDPSGNFAKIGNNIFIAQPLKLYRKEIASVPTATVTRTSLTIESLEMPGATVSVHTHAPPSNLDKVVPLEAVTVNLGQTSLSDDHPGRYACKSFTTGGVCMDPATNARRRCRTSGHLKTNYNSTSYQYLQNRNKTFQQNQFQYVQSGHTSVIPGTSGANNNVYRSQGSASSRAIYDSSGVLSACSKMARPFTPVFYKPNNPTFAQQGAVDAGSYILRRKFDSITNSVAKYRKVYGNAVASAMGYGPANSVYTYKDKVGFPLTRTPIISPYKPRGTCCTLPVKIDHQ
jgi:hypothetical protein